MRLTMLMSIHGFKEIEPNLEMLLHLNFIDIYNNVYSSHYLTHGYAHPYSDIDISQIFRFMALLLTWHCDSTH